MVNGYAWVTPPMWGLLCTCITMSARSELAIASVVLQLQVASQAGPTSSSVVNTVPGTQPIRAWHSELALSFRLHSFPGKAIQ